jgi:tRNA-2-methylthio-N6-dimethylallyladenosine synthase
VGFDSLFTFIYSPREGTPAAAMAPNAGIKEIKDRFSRLVEIQNGISAGINSGYLGKTVRVLVAGNREIRTITSLQGPPEASWST